MGSSSMKTSNRSAVSRRSELPRPNLVKKERSSRARLAEPGAGHAVALDVSVDGELWSVSWE